MNNERRKALAGLLESLEVIKGEADALRDEEREAADSVEEHFPGTERADTAEIAAERMDCLVDGFDELENLFSEAME
jgi:hypothetical protein